MSRRMKKQRPKPKSDAKILSIFSKYMTEDKREIFTIPDSEFTLEDLVGKTIMNYRKIVNPRPYNPEFESPNPKYFGVIEFSDGSILLNETISWNDGSHINSYYCNKEKKVLYSPCLYEPDLIEELKSPREE